MVWAESGADETAALRLHSREVGRRVLDDLHRSVLAQFQVQVLAFLCGAAGVWVGIRMALHDDGFDIGSKLIAAQNVGNSGMYVFKNFSPSGRNVDLQSRSSRAGPVRSPESRSGLADRGGSISR
jgi:hypothetical protein